MVKVKATVAVLGLLTAAVAVAGFTSGMLPCGQVPAPELTPRGELQPGKPPRAVELVPMGNLRGHIGGIHAVALAPNGKTLASAGVLDSQVRLWDVEARKEQATLQQGTGANVYCVAFSPDGKFLASGSNDKTIRLWEVATGKAQATLPNTVSIYAVAFSPDGKTLASAGGFQPLAEVSFQHFNEIPKELDFKEFGEVKLWDLTTGKARVFFRGDAGRINSVAFSANGKILASGGRDGAVRLWEVATGRELACFWEKGHSSSAVAFSPDGKTLAVAFIPEGKPSGLEKPAPKVALWDLPAQRERLQLRGLSGWVTALAFSPDGTLATSAQLPPSDPRQWQDASGEVQLWDVATGQPRSVPCPFRHRSSSLTFGAQGKLLATGGPRASGPGEITLWDLGLRAQKAAP